jgi:hypothetical protein
VNHHDPLAVLNVRKKKSQLQKGRLGNTGFTDLSYTHEYNNVRHVQLTEQYNVEQHNSIYVYKRHGVACRSIAR